ncbi:hypothetical protein PR003_g24015 [Phytophthora rubi]|uniref:Uncharacterized protein n=1 Tax=Phytophthora rubi TaxID=129364 RepID=A0A6A3JAR5_9STRA|nr:hypothetical protein PR001_g23439 [Phytophthora rubi]KAE8989294.1 hypothetical protein PR002_g21490 [Phytophthora rubi]KAE9295441.1 hypothetical protein PR003_g24015 [Phytophthora rubi]
MVPRRPRRRRLLRRPVACSASELCALGPPLNGVTCQSQAVEGAWSVFISTNMWRSTGGWPTWM